MPLKDKIKGLLGSSTGPKPALLGPGSAAENEKTQALRQRIDALPAPGNTTPGAAEEEWAYNLARLRHLIQAEDPRDFLNWDVIRSTMFVAEEPYVATELGYLAQHDEWEDRWEPAIQEWRAGNPQPFTQFRSSSGNLIHHAYHVARFEDATGVRVDELDLVVEFGGGYGSMRRLLNNLGFRGLYVIHDLPEFTMLQDYFLQLGGMEPDSTTFTTELEQLSDVVAGDHSSRSLLIGTWSISEAPIGLREGLVPIADRLNAHLLGYQAEFSGVDNLDFFSKWRAQFAGFEWQDIAIDHIPGANRYVFGIRASTPRST
jgi:hypothetical protein